MQNGGSGGTGGTTSRTSGFRQISCTTNTIFFKQKQTKIHRRPKGTVPDTATYNALSHAKKCFHIIHYLHSSPIDRVYPDFITDKYCRQNFQRKADKYKQDDTRQKLLHSHTLINLTRVRCYTQSCSYNHTNLYYFVCPGISNVYIFYLYAQEFHCCTIYLFSQVSVSHYRGGRAMEISQNSP